MSGKQRAVLWIGLILVGLNIVMKWRDIRDIIFSGAAPIQQPQSGSGSGGGGKPSIQIPIDPFIPGPTIPKITIPLP